MLSLDKVFNTQTVLKSIIRETNMVRAYGIAPDCELYLKLQNIQITDSFKVRGSAYKIAMLSDEEKAKGVIACSAGNHAQGVALAATKNGNTESVNGCFLRIEMETRDYMHVNLITRTLRDEGFKLV